MPTFVADGWCRATVYIERAGGGGTGFICGKKIGSTGLFFALVTNKHVLGADRRKGQTIGLGVNVRESERISGRDVLLTYTADQIVDHPTPAVDVCAIEFSGVVAKNPTLDYVWIDEGSMAVGERLRQLDISQGDDVLIIGYPLGFRQGSTYRPIVRQGMLATDIYEDLSGDAANQSSPRPAFLIDGNAVHGSSGSPIVLKPIVGRFVNGVVELGNTSPFLLGILAETRFADIPAAKGKPATRAFAGLGMGFRAQTIIETLQQFPVVKASYDA